MNALQADPSMTVPFVLLGIAIAAVWIPALRFGREVRVPPWLMFFVAAVGAALWAGVITAPAVVAIAALLLASWGARRASTTTPRLAFSVAAGVIALALAVHAVPGFFNPVILDRVVISPGAAPHTQYLNFDKGAAGLILLAVLAPHAGSGLTRRFGVTVVGGALATATAVLGVATIAGYVRPELKLPAVAAAVLVPNLFFTCVAEEAFFRGLVQERLHVALGPRPWSHAVAIGASALLFGAAHLAGGTTLALLATLAGVGYAWVYAITRRIEAAIAVHFLVNAIHFFGFTYPALAGNVR
jgi:uncharacterized protein